MRKPDWPVIWWMSLGHVVSWALLLVVVWLSVGCASTPEPVKKGDMQVIGFECDALGVKAIRIMATGVELATISWDNVTVCGDPT